MQSVTVDGCSSIFAFFIFQSSPFNCLSIARLLRILHRNPAVVMAIPSRLPVVASGAANRR
jgi:hypothetical protein